MNFTNLNVRFLKVIIGMATWILIYHSEVFAQVEVESPLYHQLKEQGQLGSVQIIPSNSKLPTTKIKVKPGQYRKGFRFPILN